MTLIIIASVLVYLGAGYLAFLALRNPQTHGRALNFSVVAFATAFALLTLYLWQYSRFYGRCPVSTPSELLVFIAWALSINYLVLGSTYRISILGWLTSPSVVAFLSLAHLLKNLVVPQKAVEKVSWAIEFHAGISLLAYGTLGLVAIVAGVYLFSHFMLKQKTTLSLSWISLPLGKLDKVVVRLAVWGCFLLALGTVSGFWIPNWSILNIKALWGVAMLLWYLSEVLLRWMGRLSPLLFSFCMVLNYIVLLGSFFAIQALVP